MTRDDKSKALMALQDTCRSWRIPYDQLNRVEQVYLLIWDLESQVCNGGFDQFFSNTSGDHANETEGACRAIGANQVAEMVAEAVGVWPGEIPVDLDARQDAMDNLPESAREIWGSLDEKFYAYPDDLVTLLYDYIEANATEMVGFAGIMR